MSLHGIKPIQEEQRLKVFIYGPPGSGKTLAALQFPNSYIIDTAKETSRYYKQIQNTKSVVFNCSDPYKIIKELETLKCSEHRFQTLVIDEVTTLYQNIQRSWTDKFVAAQEERTGKSKTPNLLEDFGFRYWDKVKRDWSRLIDAIRNLDMNVIINAHQKNEYGGNQNIIGVTSNSEKNDEYVFDFVFRLILRGKEYKAITEKQRILPIELDPEAKRFPKEFDWNYSNLLKFYNKEYIERPTKNSGILTGRKKEEMTVFPATNKAKSQVKDTPNKTEEKAKVKKETTTDKKMTNIDKIRKFLVKENIQPKDFKKFLRDVCDWKHVTSLLKLTEKEQNIIVTNWKDKILPKFRETFSSKTEEKEEIKKIYEPDKSIREDQIKIIEEKLKKENMTRETFFSGFAIDSWKEISQEGAEHMIKNFKVMIGAFE